VTASKISVDELLAQQAASPSLRVTIQAVPDDDTLVKVTPIMEGAAVCQCAFALNIAKSEISEVEPTGDTCACCGKNLLVVEVEFSNPVLADVFTQLSQRAAESVASQARSSMMGAPPAIRSNLPALPSNLELPAINNVGLPIYPAFAANEGWPAVNMFGQPLYIDPRSNMFGQSGTPNWNAPWTPYFCGRARTQCLETCNQYSMNSIDFYCCTWDCNETYKRCLSPTYRMQPCLPQEG
jgi:hypothetical protein